MSSELTEISAAIAPLREALLNHAVYAELTNLKALRVFMQQHVYAVWDFMSLLKGLQQSLSCVKVPWLPPTDRDACRLINEIVLGEESDSDGAEGYCSHFELYHRAMRRAGAATTGVDHFLMELRFGSSVIDALNRCNAPAAVKQFVTATMSMAQGRDIVATASAFTFGREDLLPAVFGRIVENLNSQADGALDGFRYYLDRHIAIDGELHGPLAEKLMHNLCGTDAARWKTARVAAVRALEARLRLWDGMLSAMTS